MSKEIVIAAIGCLVCLSVGGQTPIQDPSSAFQDGSKSGETREARLVSCPAASGSAIGGPYWGYGDYCYYLGQPSLTCDAVCSGLGGANLAAQVDSLWPDGCDTPGPQDVSTWFYDNDNAGGWTGPGGSTYARTIGYGYVGGEYYGKCSTGIVESGVYSGETSTDPSRSLVCACFQDPLIFQDGFETGF